MPPPDPKGKPTEQSRDGLDRSAPASDPQTEARLKLALEADEIRRELADAQRDVHTRPQTQTELDRAFERKETKKSDGAVVETIGGFVHSIKNGENSTTIEYQRDAQNQVKLDKDGKPLIQKIDTILNGKQQSLDLGD
ncbi:MAG TPA: hypothetical protein V6C69_07045, partial [Trichormus sp.]